MDDRDHQAGLPAPAANGSAGSGGAASGREGGAGSGREGGAGSGREGGAGSGTERATSIEWADAEAVARGSVDVLERLSGASVLITGAAGLIGLNLLRAIAYANKHLLARGCRVTALDKAGPDADVLPGEDCGIRYVRDDVRSMSDMGTVDYVIHGASIASPTQYRARAIETIETNFLGTRAVLERSRSGVRSVVFLSTSEVYGDAAGGVIPTPESYVGAVNQYGPRACYVESKRLAETLCFEYDRLYGVPVRVVRPFNVYGPGQALDDGRIVPDVISCLVRRQPVVLYSDGKSTRAFCYVADACEAILRVLLSDCASSVYNVGNPREEVTVRELAELATRECGVPVPIRYITSADGNYLTDAPTRRCPDVQRIRNELGWLAKTSLSDGLRRTYLHYSMRHAEAARN